MGKSEGEMNVRLRIWAGVAGSLASVISLSHSGYAQQGRPTVDHGTLQRALEHREKMRPASIGGKKAKPAGKPGEIGLLSGGNLGYSTRRWEIVGPINVVPGIRSAMGPNTSFVTGRVNAVAFDVKTEGIAYIATASGGVWKTLDYKPIDPTARVAWTPLSNNFPYQETSAVTVDPTNSRVLYVGLGDFYGATSGPGEVTSSLWFKNLSPNSGSTGIMKSVNGGNTFFSIGSLDTAGNPAMAGTAVSSIVVNPYNPKIVVASCGRGINPGSLWRSTDGGASWKKPVMANGSAFPTGDWSSVRMYNAYGTIQGATNAGLPRYYYATRTGNDAAAGVYRSYDLGLTWRQISNSPLVFNKNGGPGGPYELHVSPSATGPGIAGVPGSGDSNAPYVIYVKDSSAQNDDGRIYRGQPKDRLDVGGTGPLEYLWEEITDNYSIQNGNFTNWSRSEYSGAFTAVPLNVLRRDPVTSVISTLAIDGVYGGNRSLSVSLGGARAITITLLGQANLWRDIAGAFTNAAQIAPWQRDIQYDPFSPENTLIANDGGVYASSFNQDNPALTFSWLYTTNLNAGPASTTGDGNLIVTQINGVAFHPSNKDQAIIGTNGLGLVRNFNGTWRGVSITVPNYANPFAPFSVGPYISNIATSGNGGVEYAWMMAGSNNNLGGGTGWDGGQRLFFTTNGWTSATDISPDQSRPGANGTEYPYPFNNTTTGTPATNWAAETKAFAPKLVMDTVSANSTTLYTGTNRLWRFDPPTAAEPSTDPATLPPGVKGWWRRVGDNAVGGVITAIAVTSSPAGAGQRIYVGSSTGEVWMTDNARQTDNAQVPLPIIATWTRLDQDGNANSLPDRPVTSISVNEGNPAAGLGSRTEDILVTVSGAGGGHVYRCQNTRGSQIIFTDQNGVVTNPADPNFYTRLPDVPVNKIVRDSDDPVNTWYIATDIGVFVTTNQGSTWQDATIPLKLPSVPCVDIAHVRATKFLTVATYGRGIYRISTDNILAQTTLPNLKLSFTLSRTGNELIAVVTVKNELLDALGNPTGLAENVRIMDSKINSTSATGLPTTPVVLKSIAPGTSKSVTLRYPGSAGLAGTAAPFTLNTLFITQNPDGSGPVQGSANFSVRTRLP